MGSNLCFHKFSWKVQTAVRPGTRGPNRLNQTDISPHNFLYCVEDTDNELLYSELSTALQWNKLQWSFSKMINAQNQ